MTAIGVRATVLSPLTYHGLVTQGGTATITDLLSDTALMFGLASALGWMPQGVGLPVARNYAGDLGAMPYRCSLLTSVGPPPVLMPPLARKMNIDGEGGRPKHLSSVVGSGNVKDFFTVQSIAPGAIYEGIIQGEDPFALAGKSRLVVRTGLGRQSEVLLEKVPPPERVRLNAHTAQLFGRLVDCDAFHLYTLQASGWKGAEVAHDELALWYAQ